eukprot:463306-Amphidinium_carterae.1
MESGKDIVADMYYDFTLAPLCYVSEFLGPLVSLSFVKVLSTWSKGFYDAQKLAACDHAEFSPVKTRSVAGTTALPDETTGSEWHTGNRNAKGLEEYIPSPKLGSKIAPLPCSPEGPRPLRKRLQNASLVASWCFLSCFDSWDFGVGYRLKHPTL